MSFRLPRTLAVIAILSAVPMAAHAQDIRDAGPWVMTSRQQIAMETFFGGFLGSLAGGTMGLAASSVNCPAEQQEIFGCRRPTVIPEIGFSLGVGPGAALSAAGAAVRAGCDAADARRRSRRGAVRGLLVGVAPLLAYHVAGGRDERVEWTLALAGSGYQVASVTHASWGCLDAR